jgi:hypothetical protein
MQEARKAAGVVIFRVDNVAFRVPKTAEDRLLPRLEFIVGFLHTIVNLLSDPPAALIWYNRADGAAQPKNREATGFRFDKEADSSAWTQAR